jgi:hypothetical protein
MSSETRSLQLGRKRTSPAVRILAFVGALICVTGSHGLAAPQDPSPTPGTPSEGRAALSAPNAVTLSGAGRTIAVSREIRGGELQVGLQDTSTPIAICNETKTPLRPGPLKLRYLVLPDVTAPRELGPTEGVLADGPSNGVFVTNTVPDGSFVVFNLSRDPSPDRAQGILASCWKSIREAKDLQGRREAAVKTGDDAVKKTQALIVTLRQRIESQRADAATFGGRAESADRIADILKRVEETRGALTKAETDLAEQQELLATAQQALADTPDDIRGNLGMSLSDAEYTVTLLSAGALLKVGVVLVTPSKGVYYDFASYSPRSSLQLMPSAIIRWFCTVSANSLSWQTWFPASILSAFFSRLRLKTAPS